MFIRDRFTH